jgi:hypothetical protein
MEVGVDEARADDLAGGIDGLRDIPGKAVADMGDAVAFEGDDAAGNAMMAAIRKGDHMAMLDDGCQGSLRSASLFM